MLSGNLPVSRPQTRPAEKKGMKTSTHSIRAVPTQGRGEEDRTTNGKISPEEFVRIWQEAKTLDEVVEKTGIRRPTAINRACVYRLEHDVRLKKFQTAARVDWLEIQSLAHKYRKPEAG
jgi:hypothetical protein